MSRTIVAWLGTVIADHEYRDFKIWFNETFGHEVEGIGTAYTKDGLAMFFFSLHSETAVHKFAIQRLQTRDMKWACDVDRDLFTESDIIKLGISDDLRDTQALWLGDCENDD